MKKMRRRGAAETRVPWWRDASNYFAVGVVGALALLGGFGLPWFAREYFDGTYLGTLAVDDALLIGEVVSMGTSEGEGVSVFRLSRIDLAAGRVTRRISFDNQPKCQRASAQKAWCFDGRIYLLSIADLSISADSKTWFHAGGPFGVDYDGRPAPLLDPSTGILYTRAVDGRWLSLHPDGNTPGLEAEEPKHPPLSWPTNPMERRSSGNDPMRGETFTIAGLTTSFAIRAVAMTRDAPKELSAIETDGSTHPLTEFPDRLEIVFATAFSGDAVLVTSDADGTDVLRASPTSGVRWRIDL